MESTARVATERPARYIKQLAEHMSHRIQTEYADDRGSLTFAFGRCDLLAEDGTLVLRAQADDDENLARVEDVTGRHLERFLGQGSRAERVDWGGGRATGGQNELVVTWRRD